MRWTALAGFFVGMVVLCGPLFGVGNLVSSGPAAQRETAVLLIGALLAIVSAYFLVTGRIRPPDDPGLPQ